MFLSILFGTFPDLLMKRLSIFVSETWPFSLEVLFLFLVNRIQIIDDGFFQEVGHYVALHFSSLYDPVCTYQASILVIFGPTHHFVEPQLQQQLGTVPELAPETAHSGLIHTQGSTYSGGRPSLLEAPEDESPLLCVEPCVIIIGSSTWRSVSESLVQCKLRHHISLRSKGFSSVCELRVNSMDILGSFYVKYN